MDKGDHLNIDNLHKKLYIIFKLSQPLFSFTFASRILSYSLFFTFMDHSTFRLEVTQKRVTRNMVIFPSNSKRLGWWIMNC
jgi:hypothetical protein